METCEKKRGRPRCFEENLALEAALGVFLSRGYEGTSLDDLTKALGINRPSLYRAFGNKEKLFLTVLEKYHQKYRHYFNQLIKKNKPPKETLREWLSWFLQNYRSQENRWGCLIVNSTMLSNDNYPFISKELKGFHDLNEKLLSDYLKKEKKKGNFGGDPVATSQFFNAVVQGMAVLHRSQGKKKALENIVENALMTLR